MHDESLIFPAGGQTNHVHILLGIEENVSSVEYASTSGTYASMNTTLGDGFSCNARFYCFYKEEDSGLILGIDRVAAHR